LVSHTLCGIFEPGFRAGAHELFLDVAGQERVDLGLEIDQLDLLILLELGDGVVPLEHLRHPAQGFAHLDLVLRRGGAVQAARRHLLSIWSTTCANWFGLKRFGIGASPAQAGAVSVANKSSMSTVFMTPSSRISIAPAAYSSGGRCQSARRKSICPMQPNAGTVPIATIIGGGLPTPNGARTGTPATYP
jgi:hypothetical protein